jgi:aminoglycoside phosphotransferase (APT) family kinase protein
MDERTAGRLIDAQCAELAPARVVWLGEGCDSVAFAVNDEWVFRFPKSDATAEQFAIEARLLPSLAPRLPLAVPRVVFEGVPSPAFPRRFCGYRKLSGEPAIRVPRGSVRLGALVEPLARFLSALHAVPIDVACAAGVPRHALRDVLDDVRADALSDLERVREVDAAAPIDQWRAFLDALPPVVDSPAVLVHNDLAAEHLLFDHAAGTITGVIDWSDVAVSDPIVDFAGLVHWGGERFAHAVLSSYEPSIDPQALMTARYLAACRGAMDVAFGLDFNRPEYVSAGLHALHQPTTWEPTDPRIHGPTDPPMRR